MGWCHEQEFFWTAEGIETTSLHYGEELCIAPGAELKVVVKTNKKEVVRTITLSFSTDYDMGRSGCLLRRAFMVTTPNGVFLIGGHKPPFPIANAQRVHGGAPTGDKLWQVSVAWTINKPLPMIAVLRE